MERQQQLRHSQIVCITCDLQHFSSPSICNIFNFKNNLFHLRVVLFLVYSRWFGEPVFVSWNHSTTHPIYKYDILDSNGIVPDQFEDISDDDEQLMKILEESSTLCIVHKANIPIP